MHPNALLEMTTELVKQVLKLDMPADGVVSAFFRKNKNLGQRERHTLAETVYTVLRQRLLLGHLAQSGSGPMERRLAILAWAGNPGFLKGALAPRSRPGLTSLRPSIAARSPRSCATTCPTGWPSRCWPAWAKSSSGSWLLP